MAASVLLPVNLETCNPKNVKSTADEAVIAMGIPEEVVQMAHAYHSYQHGTDIKNVEDLLTLAEDIFSNPQMQREIARKMKGKQQAPEKKTKKTPNKKKDSDTRSKDSDTRSKDSDTRSKDTEEKLVAGGALFKSKPCLMAAAAEMQQKAAVSSKAADAPTCNSKAEDKRQLQEKVQRLAQENHRLRQRKVCRKCKKVDLAVSGVTFLPCGHFITCEECSDLCEDCPACGKAIMGTVRTFLS